MNRPPVPVWRSILYVPGNVPKFIDKAHERGADCVLVDLEEPTMMPARDPLRSLLFTSAERAVREVYVDGVRVVADGEPLFVDRRKSAERLARAQAEIISAVPQTDIRRRRPEAISPLTLPLM